MKTSKILFLIASLLIPASLYAAEQKFLNVGGINLSNDKIVTLDSYSCTEGKGLSQWPLDYKNSGLVCEVSRPASTPSELHSSLKEIIQNYWGHSLISVLGSLSKKPKLTLQSDIDLGQYDPSDTDNEECIFNHEPLSFPEEADIVFDGNGHKIMNLCYVENVNDKATAPAGFFGQIKSGTVKNVVFRNARVIVNPPKKGEAQVSADKYHPVGVLAGVVKNATLDGITLMDVDVRGPVAGGLAGYIENSTVKKIDAQDDIFVTNETDVDVTGGAFAGKSEIDWGAGYSVFLGGLAGATYQTDFDDVSIRAHVQESSNNSSSALGGVVGLYSYAGNKSGSSGKNAFIRNIRLTVNDEKKAFMKIAGGSTMGGLVGFASLYDYKYGTTYDLNISDVKVDSVQIGTSCGSEVYVGGLVGKGNVVAGSALKIQNSSANVNLKDELTVAQSYAYYVGGFVGFASNSISNISGGVDRFLSIQNSTVMGNIKVGANASVANKAGFSPKAYLGGFVGWAMFSADGNALAKDESGVNIVSTLEGTSGTVFAGGMVGFSNIFSNENLKLHDLQFKGTLNIVHSGDSTLVGGIVGGFPDGDGGRSISFKDITLEAPESNLINVNVHEGASAKGVLDVGGVCGYAKGVADLDKVSLKGDVTVQGKGTLDSVIVGGLIGNIFQSPAPGLNLFGTYSIGNISVADDVKAEFKKMGYMAGYVLIYALEEVQSNYHFGSSDLDVEGFGMFSTGAAIDWKNDARFSFNVRNGSANELVGLQNGTMMDVNMKKKEFAGFLNEAWDKEANYVWSFKVNSHENLPFFAKGVDKPEKPSTTKYTVKFVNFDDQLVGKEQRVKFGSKPTIPPAPTRASTVQYDYQFKEWNPVVSTVFTDMTYKAVYEPTVRSYTVTFKDFDDKQIGAVQKVEYDAMPTVPADPTRASTAQYDYEFKGWDKAIVKVTGDATYKATYDSTVRSYIVTFADYDGKQIGSRQTLKYGTKPTAPTPPTRASTAQYDYKFKGWDPAIANVTGTATYKATYDSTVRSYTVTFKDFDDKQIGSTQTVKYGTKPTAPTTPTRASTAQYDYKFKGWNPAIANVTGNATYTAVYDSTVRSYTVTFKDYDGKQIGTAQTVKYGVMPTEPATKPTRASTAKYSYTFKKWTPAIAKVTGNATYTAVYDSTVRSYTVTFKDYDGKQIGTAQTVKYDVMPTEPAMKSTRASTAKYSYTFKKWTPAIAKVTGNATYTAVYDSTIRSYTVTFVDYDGKQISKQTVEYGSTAKAPADPTRSDYNFVGWDASYSKVVSDMTISAKYEKKVTPKSSSSVKSSSSSAKSSSSVKSSSSSAKSSSSVKSSSSKAKSSSSVKSSSSSAKSSSSKAKSSSSVSNGKVLPYIAQSGNAIRVGFGTELYDCALKNEVSIRIEGETGIYIDTLITDSLTRELPELQWILAPAPVGEYEVILKVKNSEDEVLDTMSFKVDDRITVVPHAWQMVSLNMMNVDSLKKMNSEDDAFYWWDENNPMGDYWQYRKFDADDEIVAGRGYWYGSTVGTPLVIRQENPVKGSEIVWKLDSLYSGWNLIANPHGWYVDLTQGTGGKVEFWRWNAETGEYEIPTMLGPYEAVWAKVHKKTEFKVPVNPVFSLTLDSAASPIALEKIAGNEEWSLRVSLSDKFGKRDSWNILAVGNGESMDEPPAGMGDHVALSIVDGKRRLAKSVKASSDEFVWNLEVSATSTRNGFISFEGAEVIRAMGKHLYVDVDGVTTEVENSEAVNVRLSSSAKNVTVRVSSGSALANVEGMNAFRVVQLPQSMNVNFDVPEALAGANVKVKLVTVDGEVVASGKSVAAFGTNGITLKKPEFGVYFVQVQVGSQMNSARILVK